MGNWRKWPWWAWFVIFIVGFMLINNPDALSAIFLKILDLIGRFFEAIGIVLTDTTT